MGLKLQEARKKIEDKEMMTEGLGAIISKKTKDTEAWGNQAAKPATPLQREEGGADSGPGPVDTVTRG